MKAQSLNRGIYRSQQGLNLDTLPLSLLDGQMSLHRFIVSYRNIEWLVLGLPLFTDSHEQTRHIQNQG